MSFPRYPEYKDSGVEWLGEVPAHWSVVSLKRGYSVCLGKMLKPDATSPHDEYLPYLRAANIQWAGVDVSDVKSMWFSPWERQQLRLQHGDLLVSEGGDVGRSAVWNGELSACYFQNSVNRIRPFGENSTRYAYYWMFLLKDKGFIDVLCNKSTIAHFTAEKVQAVPMAFPPCNEQEVICAFLDGEVSKINGLIAEQEKLIALLKEKRQAVISHAVTKGLDPNVPMKDSGIEWLGQVPAHWGVGQSRRRFRVRSERARDGDQMLTASQKYGVLYQADFVEKEGRRVVEVIKGVESLLHAEPDDFIISMRSFQGGIEWCRLRGSVSFHYVMLTPIKDVYPHFFSYLFKCTSYIHALRATTDLIRDGQELRYSNFVQVSIPIVPLTEQKLIAEYLDAETARLDALMLECEKAVSLLAEHRSALISAAVTGKIDVRQIKTTEAA